MPLPSGTAVPAAALALFFLAALALFFLAATASAANFTCTAPRGTTCQSAIGYRVRNATTYGALASRFNTTTLAGLLGANDLPPTTAASTRVPANFTVVIPFPCLCAGNGVGQSDHVPIYTVQPQDGLDAIARNVYDGFVNYWEIATANKLPKVDLIDVGQKLWIPLPCSCDDSKTLGPPTSPTSSLAARAHRASPLPSGWPSPRCSPSTTSPTPRPSRRIRFLMSRSLFAVHQSATPQLIMICASRTTLTRSPRTTASSAAAVQPHTS